MKILSSFFILVAIFSQANAMATEVTATGFGHFNGQGADIRTQENIVVATRMALEEASRFAKFECRSTNQPVPLELTTTVSNVYHSPATHYDCHQRYCENTTEFWWFEVTVSGNFECK